MMTEESVSLRNQGVENTGWGLGWQLPHWDDEPAFGHGGATEGQQAKIVVFPRRRVIVAVLSNATAGSEMADELVSVVARRFGVHGPAAPHIMPAPVPKDEVGHIVGAYRRFGTEFGIREGGESGLEGVFEPDPDDGDAGVRVTVPIWPTREGFYGVRFPRDRGVTELAFLPGPDGSIYAAMGHRVTPRVDAA